MKYQLREQTNQIQLDVEATFTLIDFTALIVCFILGFIFAVFFWIFFAAVFIKLFSSRQFIFDLNEHEVTQYYRWFGYFRVKRREFSFWEVKSIVFSNTESGNALQDSLKFKEWFTIDIILDSNYTQITKVPEDELADADELFFTLKNELTEYFKFETDIVFVNEEDF